ncbi:uncharacterized protein N7511_001922 [Penicillium nucicola]|uniref:uncharacterized protein n=1 Tax=Penicillium nucicola TaxID=1850975 RepID=UPI0025454BBA|nr:uncharacterized protein N7511_001922 [Penicillium nucicola]KAJ5769871.1 hypothetical protein N7511_001922 [Penicillium nucicola]
MNTPFQFHTIDLWSRSTPEAKTRTHSARSSHAELKSSVHALEQLNVYPRLARERSPVHIPLRTSSRQMESQEDLGMDRKASKAQRFFGTELSLPEHTQTWESKKQRRPSYKTPPSSSRSGPRQSMGLTPFPSNTPLPDQNLRVRASSPLLGVDYRSQEEVPPLPKPSKKSITPPRVRNGLGLEPQVTFSEVPNPPKESKRKMRPPRIDLSVLFPKPRNSSAPGGLLSPQRMTNSPSPVSTVVPDSPVNPIIQHQHLPSSIPSKTERTTGHSSMRYPEAPPRRSSLQKNESHKHESHQSQSSKKQVDNSDLPSIAETKNSEWYDQPFGRVVGTSEIDLALDRYAGRRSLFSRSSVYSNSRENLPLERQRTPEAKPPTRRAHSPSTRTKDMYLSPNARSETVRPRGMSASQESGKTKRSEKSSTSKKSNRSTLKNKDLQNSSVLCLSSSSEDEDEEITPTEPKRHGKKNYSDSVATFDDDESEIFIASTAKAATVTTPTLRHFDRQPSTGSLKSQPEKAPVRRKASHSSTGKSSTGKSSQTTRRTTQTRRSSAVPTIEADLLAQFPQQPLRSPAELKELNRRSRVIAVTRQEQDLLEAMRIRKGKVTPSLFNYGNLPEADRRSILSGPSRDSFCGSDTSFLRLSNVFPPFNTPSVKGAAHPYKDGTPSQSSGSDTEQKTGNSVVSPGFSANYSESLPSPATSGASPLTPTLPIHRFSPLPSPKPPPRGPPPAIPEDQKRHSRRRTDSSGAIMLDESCDPKGNGGMPLWSFNFDWDQEHAGIATVH